MADEPSDACSRTDGDGVRAGRKNKRKSSEACSSSRLAIRNERERYVVKVFAAVALLLTYLLIKFDDEDEDDEEEEDEEDGKANARLLKAAVDCFIATKARAELELGTGNAKIEKIIGMLRLVPGYDKAVKAREDRKP